MRTRVRKSGPATGGKGGQADLTDIADLPRQQSKSTPREQVKSDQANPFPRSGYDLRIWIKQIRSDDLQDLNDERRHPRTRTQASKGALQALSTLTTPYQDKQKARAMRARTEHQEKGSKTLNAIIAELTQ